MLVAVGPEVTGHRARRSFGVVAGTATTSATSSVASKQEIQAARAAALVELLQNAAHFGANGVVDLRFEMTSLGDRNIAVLAYGVAVWLVPIEGELGNRK